MNRVLVISERDNVGTALETLASGQVVDIATKRVTALDGVPRGHKIALVDIGSGDAVIKYGHPIGVASTAIAAGSHVHVHNVMSTRGRGDAPAHARRATADADDSPAQPRLAEPS